MLKRLLLIAALACSAAAWCAAPKKDGNVYTTGLGKYEVVARTDRADARAKLGDEVKIAVRIDSELPGFASAQLFVNGVERGEARILKFGEETEFVTVAETPGTVSVLCTVLDAKKKVVRNAHRHPLFGGLGVLISPEKIAPANPNCPADFDEFWAKKRAELDAVPVRATRNEVELTPAQKEKHPSVVCYDVQVDCAGGAPVSGYLCMPRGAEPKSLPAIVVYHGSGVKSAQKQLRYGSRAIAFDVNAHGIDNGKSKEFYGDLSKGALKGYSLRDFGDHEKCYFTGMYMRVMRALDYVKSLPEWNGKVLIVTGPSQGGGQSLAAAALDPQVTLCSAGVPALCDLGGTLANRRPGWPVYLLPPEKRGAPAFIGEAAYVDGVFFARRIKCPILLSTGLIDNVCHTAAVYSAYNSLPDGTKKHMLVVPTGHHWGSTPYNPGAGEIDRILGISDPGK
jgi:cephalosporin-C deacetylase-like acetyl esterase